MKILVIVVTYNGMKWIERCLDSVVKSNTAMDLFIVDNGSTDGTQEFITSNYKSIKFYQSPENLGFGKANNLGIKYAADNNYNYVYLLNQDAWLMPDTVDELLKAHAENPAYGILSPFQAEANMKNLDSNFLRFTCSYESNPHIISSLFFNNRDRVYEVESVMAAHWMVSKECFCKVGGFSSTFKHYGEDDNYIHRAKYHNFKIGIVPSAVAIHDREHREYTKAKKILMGYTKSLVCCSNPYMSTIKKIGYTCAYATTAAYRSKSLKPYINMLKVFISWRSIMKNVRIGKECDGAFL